MEQLLVELINVTCANSIWRAAVNVAYGVLMLTAGVKDQNGFVPFAPSRMSLNVVGAYTPVYRVGISVWQMVIQLLSSWTVLLNTCTYSTTRALYLDCACLGLLLACFK